MTTVPAAIEARDDRFAAVGPAGLPDFAAFGAQDFPPAFAAAMDEHLAEIDAIADNPQAATFENTIEALERAGSRLGRIARLFFAIAGAETSEAIQAVERDLSPLLSRHGSKISMNAGLFARVDAVAKAAAAGDLPHLTAEDRRLLERTQTGFVRGGARLVGADRERLAEINARLSTLGTEFAQNIQADERDFVLPLAEADLEGLPEFLRSSLAEAAAERGRPGHALTLSRSLVVPFLTLSPRRDLREKAFAAWIARGENEGAHDNRPVLTEILALRAEKAKLLGYPSFAHYKLDDTMAKRPETVRALLTDVWTRARERVLADAEKLSALAQAAGDAAPFKPSDWRYYAEKRRQGEFSVDETALKSYFPLERMIEAAFDVAGRLFGLSFEAIPEARAWHPDARVWRVRDARGQETGIFVGDYFARPSKRSGAWMSALRVQDGLDGGTNPIVYNVCNFAKPAGEAPALLSIDDARTLFHEFGHALHGLLSKVKWPSLAGTAVSRDFVELPSQLYEHWLMVPQILSAHARHVETGEALPQALADKLKAARSFDSGFDTVEFTASALVDLALHETGEAPKDPLAREAQILSALGMPREIVMRHRAPHFAHIFAGDGYSAGYYSYLWSEVLDADAFEAFGEAGDPFDRATADRLLTHVYAAGDSRDPADLYRAFRGRMPTPDALLRKRGFAA